MSTFKHRQPIISWSSVVLLSTLILSPMTAASVLHVLAQAFPHAFQTASESAGVPTPRSGDQNDTAATSTDTPSNPRRADDEQEALRRAVAKVSRLKAFRFETDPHTLLRDLAAGAVFTVLVPARRTEPVADAGALPVNDWPAISDALVCARFLGPFAGRAPPFA